MRRWMLIALLLTGCASGGMLGEPRETVLRDVNPADISQERVLYFGEGNVMMYSTFGEFAGDKVALGATATPGWDDWSDQLKSRTEVGVTTVVERTPEARAGRGRTTATIWYFWDEDDRLIASLREDWDD